MTTPFRVVDLPFINKANLEVIAIQKGLLNADAAKRMPVAGLRALLKPHASDAGGGRAPSPKPAGRPKSPSPKPKSPPPKPKTPPKPKSPPARPKSPPPKPKTPPKPKSPPARPKSPPPKPKTPPKPAGVDYERMTIISLKQIVKDLGIPGHSTITTATKEKFIALIRAKLGGSARPKSPSPKPPRTLKTHPTAKCSITDNELEFKGCPDGYVCLVNNNTCITEADSKSLPMTMKLNGRDVVGSKAAITELQRMIASKQMVLPPVRGRSPVRSPVRAGAALPLPVPAARPHSPVRAGAALPLPVPAARPRSPVRPAAGSPKRPAAVAAVAGGQPPSAGELSRMIAGLKALPAGDRAAAIGKDMEDVQTRWAQCLGIASVK